MSKITIGFSCCICDNYEEVKIDAPAKWQVNSLDSEDVLCPKHADILPWIQSQCSGCVGGWTDWYAREIIGDWDAVHEVCDYCDQQNQDDI